MHSSTWFLRIAATFVVFKATSRSGHWCCRLYYETSLKGRIDHCPSICLISVFEGKLRPMRVLTPSRR